VLRFFIQNEYEDVIVSPLAVFVSWTYFYSTVFRHNESCWEFHLHLGALQIHHLLFWSTHFFYQFICSSREMKIMEITYSVQKEVNNCFYLTMQEQFPNWNHAAYSLIDGPNVNSFPSCLKLATVLKEAF
jgi:hypothetical protein